MTGSLAAAALAAVCAIGIARVILGIRQAVEKNRRAVEFLDKFREFAHKRYEGSFDNDLYEWLLKKSAPMQNELGELGVMTYRPPFQNYLVENYQVLYNTIPEIGKRTAHEHMIAMCDESLVRYLGFIEEVQAEGVRRLRNPFIWLRDGVRTVVALPFSILHWLGLLPRRWTVRITESTFVKVISGLVGLIGLIASIIEIAGAWDEISKFLIAMRSR